MALKIKKTEKLEKNSPKNLVGSNLSFAETEAYKLLRTNLMFSFPDEGEGRVVGITSPVQNEGKSLTACNIAYAFAEAGEKVLLLEADLRKPTIAKKLGLTKSLGFTNMLVSRVDLTEIIQKSEFAPGLDVITSGDIPPNPSELLSSNRMTQILAELRKKYTYIVVDLPPVTVVSDALAVSKNLDGIAIVVRAGVSEKKLLDEAMRQLRMVNVRILGFVYRDVTGKEKPYRKKYYNYYAD